MSTTERELISKSKQALRWIRVFGAVGYFVAGILISPLVAGIVSIIGWITISWLAPTITKRTHHGPESGFVAFAWMDFLINCGSIFLVGLMVLGITQISVAYAITIFRATVAEKADYQNQRFGSKKAVSLGVKICFALGILFLLPALGINIPIWNQGASARSSKDIIGVSELLMFYSPSLVIGSLLVCYAYIRYATNEERVKKAAASESATKDL